jgi:hypothetical protein
MRDREDDPTATITVPAAEFEAARDRLAAGRRREAEHLGRERDGMVATAVREGRITRAQASSVRRALDIEPEGTAKLLTASPHEGGLPPNTAMPVEEVGTGAADVLGTGAHDATQQAYYDEHFPGLRRR